MMTRIAQDCRKFMHSKWFWLVLALKLVAGAVFTSHFVGDLFLPFVGYFVGSGFQNPWDEFLRRGVLDAFPYSSVMLLTLTDTQRKTEKRNNLFCDKPAYTAGFSVLESKLQHQ
jgi:hypothetical protein